MKIKCIIFFLTFFVFIDSIYSQKYLELRKASKLKSYTFYPGENIRFKLFSDDTFSSGTITGIGDSTLNFNNIKVPVSRIEVIDIRDKTSNRNKAFGLLISGGSMAYFVLDFINLSLVQKANYKDVFNRKTLINSLIGVGVGASLKFFVKRKYFKRNKLNRIWIQDI